MKQLFTNNAVTLLADPILASSTTLRVLSGYGQMFPTPQANEFFVVTLEDQQATQREIIKVTERNGDVFTVLRAQEGTPARAWDASLGADTLVDHRITAETLQRVYDFTLPGAPVSGSEVIDADFTLSLDGAETVITFDTPYAPLSTSVYVGGARQKRGVDYIESAVDEIRLLYVILQSEIDSGQNIVVDFKAA